MAIIQPVATDRRDNPSHSFLHRVMAVDSAAPVQSIVVSSSGGVGIGTASPTDPLSVVGKISTTSDVVHRGETDFTIYNSNTTSKNLYLMTSGGKVQIVKYSDNTPYLSVNDSDGRVGIGVATPSEKLHVKPGASAGGILVETSSGVYNYLRLYNASSDFYVGVDSSGGGALLTGSSANAGVITQTGNYPLQFGTNATLRMTIGSAGNVGIGTAAPTQLLHVSGGNAIIECSANVQLLLRDSSAAYYNWQIGNSVQANDVLSFTPSTVAGGSTYSSPVLMLSNSDVYTNAWTDYSASSTIVGWGSFTSKYLYYKRVGKSVFINYSFSGVSDNTVITFTVPYTNSAIAVYGATGFALDNTSATKVGMLVLPNANSTVTVYSSQASGAWTNSGTKTIYGQFWYQSA